MHSYRVHSNILYLLELLEDDKRHPLAVLINIIYLKVRQTYSLVMQYLMNYVTTYITSKNCKFITKKINFCLNLFKLTKKRKY